MCMLLATSTPRIASDPNAGGKSMLFNSALGTPAWTWPPSPAAACLGILVSESWEQDSAQSFVAGGEGVREGCSLLLPSSQPEAGMDTYFFCQNNLERLKLRKKKFTAEAHGRSRCLVTPSLPDCTLA